MRTHSGRCLCGAVTFTATNVDDHFHICHCGMCRRWASGPLMAVRVESVELQGAEHLRRYRSSEWAERGFCAQCGSNLFYFLAPANRYFMSLGGFEDPAAFELGSEIFIDHKPSAYEFAGQHDKMTEAEVLAHWS